MNRVLVTGGTGFVGSNLVRSLIQNGRTVRCWVRPTSDRSLLDGLDLEFQQADIFDDAQAAQLLAEVDTVYHVAGLTSGTFKKMSYVNGTISERLAAVCSQLDAPPRFILVSSLAAAGPAKLDRPRQIADACRPISEYGRSKLLGENAVRRFASQLPISIVRPGAVFGPGDKEFLNLFRGIRVFRANPVLGSHDPPVSMIHVQDLVNLMIRCKERGAHLQPATNTSSESHHHGVYFASNPEPMTFREIGLAVRAHLGRPRAVTLQLPVSVGAAAATVVSSLARLSGKATTFNPDKIREAAAESWACDVSKTMNELNWRPQFTLHEGLLETINWYYQRGWIQAPQTTPQLVS